MQIHQLKIIYNTSYQQKKLSIEKYVHCNHKYQIKTTHVPFVVPWELSIFLMMWIVDLGYLNTNIMINHIDQNYVNISLWVWVLYENILINSKI